MSSQCSLRFTSFGFDNNKYLKLQTDAIINRLKKFGNNRLYLEMGGKFTSDAHASRVLPGYFTNNKVKILKDLGQDIDFIVSLSCKDLLENRQWTNANISYEEHSLNLIKQIEVLGFHKPYICFNFFDNSDKIIKYEQKLKSLGYKTNRRYNIKNYPNSIQEIVGINGFDRDDYISVRSKLVVVVGPGSNSGKMSTCLGQIYKEQKDGIESGYAKFETFPIWDLDLTHPVNLAYEAATADIGDYNMIDPYHKDYYKTSVINYNRDVEAFPILSNLSKEILKNHNFMSHYHSPTDMGINESGKCIIDNVLVEYKAKEEMVRRYFWTNELYNEGKNTKEAIVRIENILKQIGIGPEFLDIVSESRRTNKVAFKMNENSIEIYDNCEEILDKYKEEDLAGSTLHSFNKISDETETRLTNAKVVYTQE